MLEPMTGAFARWEQAAVDAGVRAADLIRGSHGNAVRVGLKSSPTDLVTQTDIDAEHLIRAELQAVTPDAGFIGEEGGRTASTAALQWIIDPLDGTVNFAFGLPVFSVSIAAAWNGCVVAGAVIDVLQRDVFRASLGHGARRNDLPIGVSSCAELPQALVTTGFSYNADLRRQQAGIISGVLPAVRDIRCFGSAALQLCWVASGQCDAYFERDIKIWDYSAGALVASEAGALLELPCPENDSLVFAATRLIASELRELLDVS